MSTNQRIYETMVKSTRNIYLIAANLNMETVSQLVIKQLLPKVINYNTLALNDEFIPHHTQLLTQLKKFQVYTSPYNTGIFACFSKVVQRVIQKPKIKTLIIYSHSVAVYDQETSLLQYFIDFKYLKTQTIREPNYINIEIINNQTKQNEFSIYSSNSLQVDQIDNLITQSRKNCEQLHNLKNYLCTVHYYFNYIAMSLKQFERVCNTGDILLFKKKPIPVIKQKSNISINPSKKQTNLDQQAYCNSYIILEHVAIILRNKDNQILILQKNQKGQIGINYWLNIVNRQWYKQIDKVVYRKLQTPKTPEFYNLFQTQLIKCLDKEFKTDLLDIYNITPDINTTVYQEDSPFKCGDFVAQFYNKTKLITISRQSIQFWPNDFTHKRQFPFIINQNKESIASFGPQSIIVFEPIKEQIFEIKNQNKK